MDSRIPKPAQNPRSSKPTAPLTSKPYFNFNALKSDFPSASTSKKPLAGTKVSIKIFYVIK